MHSQHCCLDAVVLFLGESLVFGCEVVVPKALCPTSAEVVSGFLKNVLRILDVLADSAYPARL